MKYLASIFTALLLSASFANGVVIRTELRDIQRLAELPADLVPKAP